MKIGVVGLGLIGGSMALAMKKSGARVVGVDSSPQTRRTVSESAAVDKVTADIEAVKECDIIFIAVPISATADIFAALKKCVSADAVMIDGGSCKRDVAAAAVEHLRELSPRFVPSHPVAGSEESGFLAARADLFVGCRAIMCPQNSAREAVEVAENFWHRAGAETTTMTVDEHDEVFGLVSHLPHLLAYALVGTIRDGGDDILRYAAGGFRDFTRIAGSDPAMWRDICLANSDNILRALKNYQQTLGALTTAVEKGDGESLSAAFLAARQLRRRWRAGE